MGTAQVDFFVFSRHDLPQRPGPYDVADRLLASVARADGDIRVFDLGTHESIARRFYANLWQ